MCAIGPIEIGLNGDTMLFQMLAPAFDFRAACSKTYMARPARAMRRNGQMTGQWRLQRLLRPEKQENAIATPKEALRSLTFPTGSSPMTSR